MASTRSYSDDETLGLPESHHPSEEDSGDTLYWDDHSSTDLCLSGDPWAHEFDDNLWSVNSEKIVDDNGKPDSSHQMPPSKGAGLSISDIPLTGQSNLDYGVEDSESMLCDVSPPLVSELCTGKVGLT